MNRNLILLVDDSEDDIIIMQRAISKSRDDCTVECVSNGIEAMSRLQEKPIPTIIFTDCKLPGMTGIDLIRSIRSMEETKFIPVLMLTSSYMDKDIKEAYTAGANSFLHKLHDLDEFSNSINIALNYWLDLNLVP